jgi:hypothetical protein
VPLAAIGPVCGLISMTLFGISIPLLGTYRPSIASTLVAAILQYVVALAVPYLTALVVERLGPSLKVQVSFLPLLTLIAYAMTPGWIAGALAILPMGGALAGLLMLVGIAAAVYSVYLLYLGVTPVLRLGQEQRPMMTGVIVVVAIVLSVVLGLITSAIGSPRPSLENFRL